jgi:hypothetical protein
MPRKVKVVNLSGDVPIVNETVEPKVDEPVNEVKVEQVVKPVNEPVLETKVEPIVETKVEQVVETKEEPKKSKAEQETGSCVLCGKTMLVKNLKYAHPKVCKKRPPSPPPQPPPTPNIIVEKVVVMQNNQPQEEYKVQATMEPLNIMQTLRQQSTEIRKQKLKNLIASAF